jgi:hypothetical protein
MATVVFIGGLGSKLPELKTLQDGRQFGVLSVAENIGKDTTRWWSLSVTDPQVWDFICKWVNKPGKPMLYTCKLGTISTFARQNGGEGIDIKASIVDVGFVQGKKDDDTQQAGPQAMGQQAVAQAPSVDPFSYQ